MIVRPRVEKFPSRSGAQQLGHVFEPPDPAEGAPVVAFFHTGGFTMGDPSWGHRFASAHLERGHTFVSLGYRLAGNDITIADMLDDAVDGIEWVAQTLVAGGAKLFTSGHSAGGYLALAPVLRDIDADVAGMAVLSAVPRISPSMGGSLLPVGAHASKFDPVEHVATRPVPAVFVHGSEDSLVPLRGSEALDEAWSAAGVPSRIVVIQEADHFFNHPMHGVRAEHELAGAVDWLNTLG